MTHLHYYKIAAKSHFELGYKLGKLFTSPSLDTYNAILSKTPFTPLILNTSEKYLQISVLYFPQYINELRGYAKGMGVDFKSFWITFLNEEFDTYPDKCTSCYTNNGMLFGHNEDFDDHYKKRITILEKTINGVTILELYYYNSLGGSAASINSFGYSQTINTLHHAKKQIGVPRNIIARWFSETKDPIEDFQKMKKIPRSLGYNHTISSKKGDIWNIESTENDAALTIHTSPFVHTNHYLTSLKDQDNVKSESNSHGRYVFARSLLKESMKKQEMKKLLEEVSRLKNEHKISETIGRFVVDRKANEVDIWLKRESKKGWVSYPICY